MLARAPGKLVLSGAYAVLDGAPAIVSAVNRYVVADAMRLTSLVTAEVAAALEHFPETAAPWFDASALRARDQKLGLGSSAAIVVASLAAIEVSARGLMSDIELQRAVLSPALDAHRRAQGGGSGVDVACAVIGGTSMMTVSRQGLRCVPVGLPKQLHVSAWFSGRSASTRSLLERVHRFRTRRPSEAQRLLGAQAAAAEAAARALTAHSPRDFLLAAARQSECLDALGAGADAPIVTRKTRQLDKLARKEGGVVLPAGAGGGDIATFFGIAPPSVQLASAARERGYVLIEGMSLGARGVHAVSESAVTDKATTVA